MIHDSIFSQFDSIFHNTDTAFLGSIGDLLFQVELLGEHQEYDDIAYWCQVCDEDQSVLFEQTLYGGENDVYSVEDAVQLAYNNVA